MSSVEWLKPWPPVFPSFIVGCMLAHVRMDVDFGFSPLLESAHIRLFLIKNGKIRKNCLQNPDGLAELSTGMPNFTRLVFFRAVFEGHFRIGFE